jgi:hypothetical protein
MGSPSAGTCFASPVQQRPPASLGVRAQSTSAGPPPRSRRRRCLRTPARNQRPIPLRRRPPSTSSPRSGCSRASQIEARPGSRSRRATRAKPRSRPWAGPHTSSRSLTTTTPAWTRPASRSCSWRPMTRRQRWIQRTSSPPDCARWGMLDPAVRLAGGLGPAVLHGLRGPVSAGRAAVPSIRGLLHRRLRRRYFRVREQLPAGGQRAPDTPDQPPGPARLRPHGHRGSRGPCRRPGPGHRTAGNRGVAPAGSDRGAWCGRLAVVHHVQTVLRWIDRR